MHILAEEILKLKELVGSAIRAINREEPDLAGVSRDLAEALNFLDEIVEEQPRPVRAESA